MPTFLDRATGWFRKTDEHQEIMDRMEMALAAAAKIETKINRIEQMLCRVEQAIVNSQTWPAGHGR
jgi:hypothetical protein